MRGAGKAPTGAFVGIAGCIAKASKWAIPGVMGVDGIDGKGGGIIGNMDGTGKMGCVDPIPGACIFGGCKFTGSTALGTRVAKAAGTPALRAVLELTGTLAVLSRDFGAVDFGVVPMPASCMPTELETAASPLSCGCA